MDCFGLVKKRMWLFSLITIIIAIHFLTLNSHNNSNDGGGVIKTVYLGTHPVVSFKLLNAGHTVPSRTVVTPNSAAQGTQNRDIEFAVEAWQFFAQFL
jgi:poly(3-hydroxybutyrate) depolymerase